MRWGFRDPQGWFKLQQNEVMAHIQAPKLLKKLARRAQVKRVASKPKLDADVKPTIAPQFQPPAKGSLFVRWSLNQVL